MNNYEDLYSQKHSANADQIKEFLETLDLPAIGKNQNDLLTLPVSRAEIEKVVNKLKTNWWYKQWYKTFSEQLIPLMEL